MDDLIRELEELRDLIRPYDNGRGEGDYFADELDAIIQRHKPAEPCEAATDG